MLSVLADGPKMPKENTKAPVTAEAGASAGDEPSQKAREECCCNGLSAKAKTKAAKAITKQGS